MYSTSLIFCSFYSKFYTTHCPHYRNLLTPTCLCARNNSGDYKLTQIISNSKLGHIVTSYNQVNTLNLI